MESICHGCGEPYEKCQCEKLEEEKNIDKYPDDDPNDGYYQVLQLD